MNIKINNLLTNFESLLNLTPAQSDSDPVIHEMREELAILKEHHAKPGYL